MFAFACVASIKAQIEVTCGGKYVNNGDVLNFMLLSTKIMRKLGLKTPPLPTQAMKV